MFINKQHTVYGKFHFISLANYFHLFRFLENVSAGTQPQRKKGILFGDKRSLNFESSDDLTSLSPLNEDSGLILLSSITCIKT